MISLYSNVENFWNFPMVMEHIISNTHILQSAVLCSISSFPHGESSCTKLLEKNREARIFPSFLGYFSQLLGLFFSD